MLKHLVLVQLIVGLGPVLINDSGSASSHVGIWRPGNGRWFANTADDTVLFRNIKWGSPGDVP